MASMTFQQSIVSLEELFGQRNRMHLRGDRAIFLIHQHFANLQNEVFRKGGQRKDVEARQFASLFAITIGHANSFGNLPLVEATCRKYPQGKCNYCKKSPCDCAAIRDKAGAPPTLAPPSAVRMDWHIREFVRNLDALYGENNRERGLEWAFLRLIAEIHEAEHAHLFDQINNPDYTLVERRFNLAKEFADVIAWIFSISAMRDIDIQSAIEKRYGGNCWRCDKRPCICGAINAYKARANPIPGHAEEANTVTG